MLTDFTPKKVYIACGYTDLRRGVDGLAAMVEQDFSLDQFDGKLFLFCGRRADIKPIAEELKGLNRRQNPDLTYRNRIQGYEQGQGC